MKLTTEQIAEFNTRGVIIAREGTHPRRFAADDRRAIGVD